MRVVLADLRATDGFVSKDTVAGGYGSRMRPFSRVTSVIAYLKGWFHDIPSVQMAYLAAIFARAGHEVVWTQDELADGDLAVVLSSLVDYRREAAWADRMRERGVPTGFVGLAASKMPELFKDHADFVINGEPETAAMALARGDRLAGIVHSEEIHDLDVLPFPRWDLVTRPSRHWMQIPFSGRPRGGGFSVMASRGCPEFCTYCPHRILSGYRARSVSNVVDELQMLCEQSPNPYIVFRDPLFSEERERCLELCDLIKRRDLRFRFECETRLDRLDEGLLDTLYDAGLRAMSFGVESVSGQVLKKVGRRPIADPHQRAMVAHCRKRGIVTAAFYVFGFLEDDWASIAATIDHSIELGSTVAQFKILTPYPGTPLYKRMQHLVYEQDWQRFDGFTPTFNHPNLTTEELKFLLGAAYTRFYMRPSYLANYCRVHDTRLRALVHRLDRRVSQRHSTQEAAEMSRAVTC